MHGLIEAYRELTLLTVNEGERKKIIPVQIYRVVYDYIQQSLIDQLHHHIDLITLDAEYTEKVKLTLACPVSMKDQFLFHIEKFKHLLESFEVMETDRKSTRLNSSHVAISYAVFCLKKKKNTE